MNYRVFNTIALLFFFSLIMNGQVNEKAEVITIHLTSVENFPNNPVLPVLLYRNVFNFKDSDSAGLIETVFEKNGWRGRWRNGIYNFQHYHSTAHEALGVYSGWAEVQLGGPGNLPLRIEEGDMVVLPAGTSHRLMDSGGGFAVVGAYPDGQLWDMNYGEKDEVERAISNIKKVKIPSKDPVFGENGKMFITWK